MLKRIGAEPDETGAAVAIKDAAFPAPFPSGLEYGAPARGMWNIVHTGMLLPEAHQIFVCAAGCLRGVVLTAAEMKAEERFSTVEIREENVLDGDMEELIIDGVTDILNKLPCMPPAVLIFTSCIHHFMNCDLPRVYRVLRERFPQTAFTDCYMNPIMRKSGLTPDQLMRKQLYSLLKPRPKDPKAVNLIGNDLPTDASSELVRMIQKNGFRLRDITRCRTYGEYQEMAEASVNLSTYPSAVAGCEELERRLGQKQLYLPQSFDYDEIEDNLCRLAGCLSIDAPQTAPGRARAERALQGAREVIGDMAVSVDYTATPRPLGLARLLCQHGFRVVSVYLDAINEEERGAFGWLRTHVPELMLRATIHPKMRVLPRAGREPVLAIGQKAAYFTGTRHFVNIVEGGGMYGYDGIARLAGLMTGAYLEERDARSLIQAKGLGCACCI